MAYAQTAASPRSSYGKGGASPRKTTLEDGPIKELVQIIESTRPEQWQKRTAALADLVAQIPGGHEYSRREAWYNNPPTLRHLHQPIGELLKDPRSTVVKRTCEALTELFAKCQGDAKYLLKDLMPVVLNVHAQTVQVIRNQVQVMVLEAIPVVPCKMAMPLWLDRLKTDKSRTVREACVLYLGMGLKHWTDDQNSDVGAGYLTEENWQQIGTALIKTLRDPSPTVRSHAKTGIETIRDAQPELWDALIRDPDGPAGKDMKLQKWLIKVSEGEEDLHAGKDDLSVASRYSNFSMASKTDQELRVPRPAKIMSMPLVVIDHQLKSMLEAVGNSNHRNSSSPDVVSALLSDVRLHKPWTATAPRILPHMAMVAIILFLCWELHPVHRGLVVRPLPIYEVDRFTQDLHTSDLHRLPRDAVVLVVKFPYGQDRHPLLPVLHLRKKADFTINIPPKNHRKIPILFFLPTRLVDRCGVVPNQRRKSLATATTLMNSLLREKRSSSKLSLICRWRSNNSYSHSQMRMLVLKTWILTTITDLVSTVMRVPLIC
jgi:hypothetical protein